MESSKFWLLVSFIYVSQTIPGPAQIVFGLIFAVAALYFMSKGD